MTSSELSLRLARTEDAANIAKLSRDTIECGSKKCVLVAGILTVALEIRARNEGAQLL